MCMHRVAVTGIPDSPSPVSLAPPQASLYVVYYFPTPTASGPPYLKHYRTKPSARYVANLQAKHYC
jgi:hypothetical protein